MEAISTLKYILLLAVNAGKFFSPKLLYQNLGSVYPSGPF